MSREKAIQAAVIAYEPKSWFETPVAQMERAIAAYERALGGPSDEPCGRVMVGSGGDTYDPICELHKGHRGPCKSTAAVDQHRLYVRPRNPPKTSDAKQGGGPKDPTGPVHDGPSPPFQPSDEDVERAPDLHRRYMLDPEFRARAYLVSQHLRSRMALPAAVEVGCEIVAALEAVWPGREEWK